jgi:hypothetical protein
VTQRYSNEQLWFCGSKKKFLKQFAHLGADVLEPRNGSVSSADSISGNTLYCVQYDYDGYRVREGENSNNVGYLAAHSKNVAFWFERIEDRKDIEKDILTECVRQYAELDKKHKVMQRRKEALEKKKVVAELNEFFKVANNSSKPIKS